MNNNPLNRTSGLIKKVITIISGLIVLGALTTIILSMILQRSTFPSDLQKPNLYDEFNYLSYTTNEMSFDIIYNDKKDLDVFVYFHGNIGRLNYILDYLNKNTSFIAIAYPGYHQSTGEPSVAGTLTAIEALTQVIDEKYDNDVRLHLIGHSLGSQTASYFSLLLKDELKLRSISVVGGFPSVRHLCENTLGIFKAMCFVANDSFNAVDYFSGLTESNLPMNMRPNIFIYHLPSDDIIPYSAGKKLFDDLVDLPNQPKVTFYDLSDGTHGEFNIDQVVKNATN